MALSRAVRAAGLLVGLAVCAVAVSAWRIAPADGPLGTDLAIVAPPRAELGIQPSGRVLTGRSLSPGGPSAVGELTLTNRTGEALALRPRLLSDDDQLDEIVDVRLTAAGRVLRDASLGHWRRAGGRTLTLAAGQKRTVKIRASIAPLVDGGWRGRVSNVDLELDPRTVR